MASLTEVDGRVYAVNPDVVLQMNGDPLIMTSESSEGGVVRLWFFFWAIQFPFDESQRAQ